MNEFDAYYNEMNEMDEVYNEKEYYKITGSDEGEEIKPQYVHCSRAGLSRYLTTYGDSTRYYEPITRQEYQSHISE